MGVFKMRLDFIRSGLFVVLAFASAPCFAWGSRGHSVVNYAATDLMSSPAAGFFRANKTALGRLANVPDVAWKTDGHYESERPYHFFHWDVFGNARQANEFNRMVIAQVVQAFGQAHIDDNGSAPWRISQIYERAVAAFKSNDQAKALQMVGVLGHYIGDLANPMHVSKDYDGQSIGRRGVHKYFETTLVDTVPADELSDSAIRDGAEVRINLDRTDLRGTTLEKARQISINESVLALAELDDVLDNFSQNSQNDRALAEHFGPRMGSAAATLAKLWDMIVIEAGVATSLGDRALQVDDPQWFAIDTPMPSR